MNDRKPLTKPRSHGTVEVESCNVNPRSDEHQTKREKRESVIDPFDFDNNGPNGCILIDGWVDSYGDGCAWYEVSLTIILQILSDR